MIHRLLCINSIALHQFEKGELGIHANLIKHEEYIKDKWQRMSHSMKESMCYAHANQEEAT
jgi:hypothetical protein